MSGSVQNDGWEQKPTLKSNGALGGFSVIALLFAFFKARPYFEHAPRVQTYNGSEQTPQHHSGETVKKNSNATLLETLTGHQISRSAGGARSGTPRTAVKVIERPLLDGLTVTVTAVLSRGISSLEAEPDVEATFGTLIRSDDTRELDDDPLKGARLTGMAFPNLDLKRMVLKFSELVTRDGRQYAIQATAIDPETQTQGVPADYSSGLGSRLAGVGISRVITAGDQILMAKVMPDNSRASLVQQAAQESARQMNDQAANDISLEATRNLRETKAELSLPARTPLTLRLRALSDQPTRSNSSSTTQSF